MNHRPDTKIVERTCYEALSALGIQKKYLGGIFTINADFLGQVGLAPGVQPTVIRIHPNIGVHCVPVMKLVCAASGEKYQKGRFATLNYPLGVACPDIDQFYFEREADILPESARLAATIKQYGIPYIDGLASYSAILPRMHQQVDNLGGMPERYAAALYLSGDRQGAFAFLDEQITKFLTRNDNDFVAELRRLKSYIEFLK